MSSHHSFLIHLSVNGHLGFFHVLAIVNCAVMNTGVQVCVCVCVCVCVFSILVFSMYMSSSGIAGSYGSSVFISIPKNGTAKECSNYHTIALISHASKVMLKILQARVQQYMNCEHPDVQAGFRRGRRNRDQIANIHWIIEKAREFQKNIYFFCLF